MKCMIWMCLPLALVLGCHHNLQAPPHCTTCGTSGGAAAGQMGRRFPNSRTQVAFVNPVGMKVGWESSMGSEGRTFMPAQLTVPGRYNFDQGAIYRLKVSDVAGHP